MLAIATTGPPPPDTDGGAASLKRADGHGWRVDVLSLPMKALNRLIKAKGLSPEAAKDLKAHRRRVKNRMYTQLSRDRRAATQLPITQDAAWAKAVALPSASQRTGGRGAAAGAKR